MLGMPSVSLNYVLYAYASSTKSQDLIRHTEKGIENPHFLLQ